MISLYCSNIPRTVWTLLILDMISTGSEKRYIKIMKTREYTKKGFTQESFFRTFFTRNAPILVSFLRGFLWYLKYVEREMKMELYEYSLSATIFSKYKLGNIYNVQQDT